MVSNYYRSMKSTTPLEEKAKINTAAMIEVIVIMVCVVVSLVALVYEIVKLLRKIFKKDDKVKNLEHHPTDETLKNF